MNVKSITLVLENCEEMVLKYPDVVYFDIYKPYSTFNSYMNVISKSDCVKGFSMGIRKGVDLSESNSFSDGMNIKRLASCDVTQLDIKYEDGTNDYYLVNWDCKNEQCNDKQVFEETPSGNYIFYSYTGKPPKEKKINRIRQSTDFLVDMNK